MWMHQAENIRDQFQILPFKEPSATLFQLMGFCVEAGNRFAGISDPMTGDMNSQAPVGTTVALLERGSRVMSGVQKRCYNAMRREFKIFSTYFLANIYLQSTHMTYMVVKERLNRQILTIE
jgi:hypothetical protein